jgi:hypothetical protein
MKRDVVALPNVDETCTRTACNRSSSRYAKECSQVDIRVSPENEWYFLGSNEEEGGHASSERRKRDTREVDAIHWDYSFR